MSSTTPSEGKFSIFPANLSNTKSIECDNLVAPEREFAERGHVGDIGDIGAPRTQMPNVSLIDFTVNAEGIARESDSHGGHRGDYPFAQQRYKSIVQRMRRAIASQRMYSV